MSEEAKVIIAIILLSGFIFVLATISETVKSLERVELAKISASNATQKDKNATGTGTYQK